MQRRADILRQLEFILKEVERWDEPIVAIHLGHAIELLTNANSRKR